MSAPPLLTEPDAVRGRPWGWITFAIIVTILFSLSLFANTTLLGLLAAVWSKSDETTFKEERIGGDASAK